MLEIEAVKKEYETLINQLSDPELVSDWEKFEQFSKRKNFLEKIIAKNEEIEEIKNKIEGNKDILKAGEDPELTSLAETEITMLLEKQKELEEQMKNLSSEEPENKKTQSAIIEIRAGTGGDEAALFAERLFRMYSRYAQIEGWNQKILDSRPTELGGIKEIIFELSPGPRAKQDGNKDVYLKMKYEGGVHRVQRIPKTEKGGRIHTSTASVAVLPKPKNSALKIKSDELKIDFFRSSGPGGQNVNKRETAVRVTHLPTGIVVSSQNERNQLQNKENAMKILEVKILEKKQEEEVGKVGEKRKTQIGRAKRVEKIRTYNFPQDRITDHRIKKSWRNLEEIMDGKLDPIIKALQKSEI